MANFYVYCSHCKNRGSVGSSDRKVRETNFGSISSKKRVLDVGRFLSLVGIQACKACLDAVHSSRISSYDGVDPIYASENGFVMRRISIWFCLAANQGFGTTDAFHDCIQASHEIRNRRHRYWQQRLQLLENEGTAQVQQQNESHQVDQVRLGRRSKPPVPECAGGLCVGMTNGPHEGGNASYPVAWNGTHGTSVWSYMTVPELPTKIDDIAGSLTYYIWTDIFFGDGGFGRMNQFVPQLILGHALDGSTGQPNYEPIYGSIHKKWMFGSHYFFETYDPETNKTMPHAAYGPLFPTEAGEILYTKFEISLPSRSGNVPNTNDGQNAHEDTTRRRRTKKSNPQWILTMGVFGDETRVSTLVVDRPYMGMGEKWGPNRSISWLESSYRNMCINACWELYGAKDINHLPSSGSRYQLYISQPDVVPSAGSRMHVGRTLDDADLMGPRYNFTTWEEDEGNGTCPSCSVRERHTELSQEVLIDISVDVPPLSVGSPR